jgi:hypothetical protein
LSEQTDFGFETVSPEEKSRRVRGVFDSVAGKYDVMNDVMSAGMHRLWKRFAVNAAAVRDGMRILDLAGGTGDLAALFASRAGASGEVVLTDVNRTMLAAGRDRLINEGQASSRPPVHGREASVRGCMLRSGQHRVRTAQRHRQGRRAARNASRGKAGGNGRRARILAGMGAVGTGV